MPVVSKEIGDKFLHSERNILRNIVETARKNAEGVVNLPMRETNPAGKISKIPDSMRAIIGAVSKVAGPTAAAEQFGISVPTAHHIEHGHRGGDHDVIHTKDKDKIDKELDPIRELALGKLKTALNHITDEKLGASKATELAQVARSMSGVIKDINPDSSDKNGTEKYQFNIYAPQVVSENHYTTVEA